jgi:hypothetical protein
MRKTMADSPPNDQQQQEQDTDELVSVILPIIDK